MDSVSLLIRSTLLLLLALVVPSVHAQGQCTQYRSNPAPPGGAWHASPSIAADAYIAYLNGLPGATANCTPSGGPQQQYQLNYRALNPTATTFAIWYTSRGGATCAPTDTFFGTYGMHSQTGPNCAPPSTSCAPDGAEQSSDSTTRYSIPGTGTTACLNGCLAVPEWMYGSGATRWGRGPWTSMGLPCTGGGNTTPQATPDANNRCEPGTCPGTFNGVAMCLRCSVSNNDVMPPPPAASGVPPQPSPGVTTTTANPDGTVTTTTSSPGGGQQSTSTSPGQQIGLEGYCLRNPAAYICTGRPSNGSATPSDSAASAPNRESSFGGACQGGFSCDGDAIQCAIAREQHVRSCQLFDSVTPESTAGREAVARGDQRASDHPYASESAVSLDLSSRIDTTPAFGGSGGCPADVSVALGTVGTYAIPFSSLCPYLQALSWALRGLAFFVAAYIVFGVRTSGG